jgi:hypothetical protein
MENTFKPGERVLVNYGHHYKPEPGTVVGPFGKNRFVVRLDARRSANGEHRMINVTSKSLSREEPVLYNRGDRVRVTRSKYLGCTGTVVQDDDGARMVIVELDNGQTVHFNRRILVGINSIKVDIGLSEPKIEKIAPECGCPRLFLDGHRAGCRARTDSPDPERERLSQTWGIVRPRPAPECKTNSDLRTVIQEKAESEFRKAMIDSFKGAKP